MHLLLCILPALLFALPATPIPNPPTCDNLLTSHLASPEFAHLAKHALDPSFTQTPDGPNRRFVHFLHVPRTAGRTWYLCFLKPLFLPSQRCARGYDVLRLGDSFPTCRLLSTHDDFSVSQFLPEDTQFMTQLRDPVSRFLSAYEFAVEVAARGVKRRPVPKIAILKTLTNNVWPWSILIPFLQDDMIARQEKLRAAAGSNATVGVEGQSEGGVNGTHGGRQVLGVGEGVGMVGGLGDTHGHTTGSGQALEPLNPYDNPLVMSLEDFIKHPITKETLHNQQTLQLLGISNYSHWGEAASTLRSCFWRENAGWDQAGQAARKLLRYYSHVGLTEHLLASMDTALPLMERTWSNHAYKTAGQVNQISLLAALQKKRRTQRQKQAQSARGRIRTQGQGIRSKFKTHKTLWPPPNRRETRTTGGNHVSQTEAAGQSEGQDEQSRDRVTQEPEAVAPAAQAPQARQLLAHDQQLLGHDRQLLARDPNLDKFETLAWPDLTDEQSALLHSWLRGMDMNQVSKLKMGRMYTSCADMAQKKNKERSVRSTRELRMPDGRSFVFSRQSRSQIEPRLLELIAGYNQQDTMLHERGVELLRDYKIMQEIAWEVARGGGGA